ncbi:alpha/beta fold hydrolase [Metabacillus endolithicus]|uniref:Alpha/beta fold hydrolase n=1 Tax=Metabacillus endolithicus TaxID=1535204 RepID=A0ABW5BWJ6_9BACI|nr:alpha/beta hydrolase [Metabacillus endolithicus]UPG62895.1 alpha/beta hydrolase [Metabacillus endolithicus]
MTEETQYHDSYNKSLELWPVEYSTYYVNTAQGKTHIIESGNKTAPSLILLHGGSMSSTMWYPNVMEWSKNYRVICVDILGDKNKSIPQIEFIDRPSYALWLKDVLDTLQIKKADIVGLSYGALNVVNFLLFYPEIVNRVVLMSPAATYVPFDSKFYTHAFGMVKNPSGVQSFLNWIFDDRYKPHPFIAEQLVAAMNWVEPSKSTAPKENGFPYVFTDEELASIRNPILLMFGENEVMYNVDEAYKRAENSSPCMTVELVEEVGHLMSMENPSYINRRVLEFLSEQRRNF